MQHFRHTGLLLGMLLVLLAASACSGDDCPINNTVMGKMAFYNQQGEAVGLVGTLTVSVVRPQGDSVVLNQKVGSSEVNFPLSYNGYLYVWVAILGYPLVPEVKYISIKSSPQGDSSVRLKWVE